MPSPIIALAAFVPFWQSWLLDTLPFALVFGGSAYAWRRTRSRLLLGIAVVVALPTAGCSAIGARNLTVDVQRALIAREMDVSLSDRQFDRRFPVGYLSSPTVIVPGRTTREGVRALVKGALSRYECDRDGHRHDTFFFFSEATGDDLTQGLGLVVTYGADERVRSVEVYDDSLQTFVDGCARF